jgi:hypothetical protein
VDPNDEQQKCESRDDDLTAKDQKEREKKKDEFSICKKLANIPQDPEVHSKQIGSLTNKALYGQS